MMPGPESDLDTVSQNARFLVLFQPAEAVEMFRDSMAVVEIRTRL